MGIKIAPVYAQQAVMTTMFRDLMDFVECFIDDFVIFTKGSFEQHLQDVDKVLSCNTITPEGIEPQPQKVSTILNIASPKTPK
jgi:hypothetical protein